MSSQEARDKQRQCFIDVYDAVKDIMVSHYDRQPLTLNQIVQIIIPVMTSVSHDHIDGDKTWTIDDKEKAYQETCDHAIDLLIGMKEKGGSFKQ